MMYYHVACRMDLLYSSCTDHLRMPTNNKLDKGLFTMQLLSTVWIEVDKSSLWNNQFNLFLVSISIATLKYYREFNMTNTVKCICNWFSGDIQINNLMFIVSSP